MPALRPKVVDVVSSGHLTSIASLALVERDKRQRAQSWQTDPVLWAQDYLGVRLWSRQKDILYSIRDNRNTAVAAGHGVGKSFVAAIAMAWWVDVHPPTETFVASTAPFQDQITAILWNNLRGLYLISQQRYKDGLVDHPLPGYVTGDNKIKLDNGIMLGQGRKPPDSKTDSGYQGLHAKYLLAIGDEAAGLNQDMISALGNIATGSDNRVLLIANPTDPNSAMAEIWKKNLSDWKTMHISVLDAPTIKPDPDFPLENIGGMSGLDYVAQMEARWGEQDPHYITRVLGQWAFEAGNNVFSEAEIARGVNCHVEPDPNPIIQFGCDIARMGPDSTYVYEYIEGDVWATDPETGKPTEPTGQRGGILRFVESWNKAPLVSSDPANYGTAERIHSQALARGASIVAVDASGLGGGAIDGLTNLGGTYAVVEVYGSAPSTDKRAYLNVRAEQYFEIKRMLHAGVLDLDPKDTELLDELRGIVFEFTTSGAVKMESKDDMKKRGAKSPDRADAAWYATYNVIEAVFGPQAGEVIQYDVETAITEADVFYSSGWW
jgi:hypothetical protein